MARLIAARGSGKLLKGVCRLGAGVLVGTLVASGTGSGRAQGPEVYRGGLHARQMVVEAVDNARRVTLPGNVPAEATLKNDLGVVEDAFPLEHLQLVLQRPLELETALEQALEEMQRKGSPTYHKWLTAEQFGAEYGPAPADIQRVADWLVSQGFQVEAVPVSGMVIQFSGDAGRVRRAFGTQLHKLEVNGEPHFANISEPTIPAALAGVVKGVSALHNFMPHSMMKKRPKFTFTQYGTTFYAVTPGDLATIYNMNPLFGAGTTGAGQTVVVIENTKVYSTSDISTFRSAFGLTGYGGTFTQEVPSGSLSCANPGTVGQDEGEATLDAEWAGASAPGAAVVLAACTDTQTTFGGLVAVENLVNGMNPPKIMSMSYGECEQMNGSSQNALYVSTFQQAAMEGISVFVSAGDEGAASCDANQTNATHGIAVNGFASTPYNVAVGGTDFEDLYNASQPANGGAPLSTYWSSTDSTTSASALSYIPEIPWDDSCASAFIYGSNYQTEGSYTQAYGDGGFCNSVVAEYYGYLTTGAGSGGPSSHSGQPSWQTGVAGLPTQTGGVRYLPDVSLFAANGIWDHFYLYCDSDVNEGGAVCDTPEDYSGAGGTSFSSPILAGVQALINQATGESQGNPNPTFYELASQEYGASESVYAGGSQPCNSSAGPASNCVFYDVTQGDMAVNCSGSLNCYFGSPASGSYGVLSVSESVLEPAYGTQPGWDFATGLGTVNVANLVGNFSGVMTSVAVKSGASPSNLGASVTFTATVTPAFGTAVAGTVTWSTNTGCAVSPVVNGQATCVTSALKPGSNYIGAKFTGAAGGTYSIVYASSYGSMQQQVTDVTTHLVVSIPSVVRAGQSFPVSVTAEDVNNSVVTSYAGTVSFASSDGSAILPANSTLTNGLGTFYVTLSTTGVQSVTATDTVSATVTGSASTTVDVGSVWVGNGNGSLSAFDLLGKAYSPTVGYTSSGLTAAYGMAVDASENVWVGGPNGVSELSDAGSPVNTSPYTVGGVNQAYGLAFDGAGHLWVANASGAVSELSAAGTALSPMAGFQGTRTQALAGISVDTSGDVWLAVPGTNSVIELLGAGVPVAPLAAGVSRGVAVTKP